MSEVAFEYFFSTSIALILTTLIYSLDSLHHSPALQIFITSLLPFFQLFKFHGGSLDPAT